MAGYGITSSGVEPLDCIIGELFNNLQVSSEGTEMQKILN
jgi:hypothetical protein